ncbi:MAG: TldD/PmbA family protein [Alphaproteobacteria bacterium]|nr:TldD/PmbA family protein [Alphaproteobacteria bacterium]
MTEDRRDLLTDLLARARRAGADAADAMMVDTQSQSAMVRLGKTEVLDRAESADLGLRVLIGKRQAIVSSTDFSPATLDELAQRAAAMAKLAPEDEFCGLAEPGQLAGALPALDTDDGSEPAAEKILQLAKDTEAAALAVPGVTNSSGGEASWAAAAVTLAGSNGFAGSYRRTRHDVAVAVLAGEGTAMERDYDYSSATFFTDQRAADDVGRRAGERAVKRLGGRKMPSGKVPVVFEPRVAGSLVGHLLGAISGAAIARGTSFLKDSLGKQVFPAGITITDDPLRARGLRSRPFDAEGIKTQTRNLVDSGVLTTWLLDLRSSRQLKMQSTGHAARSPGGPPGPSATNVYMAAGKVSFAELIADIERGFFVTDMMGMGVNGVTGDYSRGASGFWIEKGQIAFPVNEMTIAGNLKEMFRHLVPANDLRLRNEIEAPSVRIEGMTVAGV